MKEITQITEEQAIKKYCIAYCPSHITKYITGICPHQKGCNEFKPFLKILNDLKILKNSALEKARSESDYFANQIKNSTPQIYTFIYASFKVVIDLYEKAIEEIKGVKE